MNGSESRRAGSVPAREAGLAILFSPGLCSSRKDKLTLSLSRPALRESVRSSPGASEAGALTWHQADVPGLSIGQCSAWGQGERGTRRGVFSACPSVHCSSILCEWLSNVPNADASSVSDTSVSLSEKSSSKSSSGKPGSPPYMAVSRRARISFAPCLVPGSSPNRKPPGSRIRAASCANALILSCHAPARRLFSSSSLSTLPAEISHGLPRRRCSACPSGARRA